ncbi:hypothetical protein ZOD2009_05502 [Haladaptatus paucihalophilus DX253]|uniref:Uncharacterized protein n=1 Tax=Haladaptatus paucihalophilus DX253 TaxID=797209 RepID=E7QQN0_HALPU|nr:hypothetical protein ZOD2009_05502 [Haladaptatus paucihalophilus DX253]
MWEGSKVVVSGGFAAIVRNLDTDVRRQRISLWRTHVMV